MSYIKNDKTEWPPSDTWWNKEFIELTNGGVEPYLFKSMLPKGFPPPTEIENIIKNIQHSDISDPASSRVRVYIEEDRRDDLANQVVNGKIPENLSIKKYIQDLSKADRFSLVVNRLQDWSQPLTEYIGELLGSMYRARGIPIGGSEMVAFAGNYSGTAFGVHRGYEHALLIHLGPGTKYFHCWSEELYTSLTGTIEPTFGDYTKLLDSSTEFVMEPGDFLFLPALVFHVGRQDDFSVSVACPLYTYPTLRFTKHLMETFLEKVPFDQTGMSNHINFSLKSDEIKNIIKDDSIEISNKISAELPILVEDYWFRLISNGGFDLTEFQENRITKSKFDIDKNTIIKLIKPYSICWIEEKLDEGDLFYVYLKGYKLKLEYSKGIIELFVNLNNRESIKINSKKFTDSIKLLLSTGAFEINL